MNKFSYKKTGVQSVTPHLVPLNNLSILNNKDKKLNVNPRAQQLGNRTL